MNPTWEVASFHGNDLRCSSLVVGGWIPPPGTLTPASLGTLWPELVTYVRVCKRAGKWAYER